MSASNGHTAQESQAEATRNAYRAAEQARTDAVKRLLETADQLREDAEKSEGDVKQSALILARSLEQSANRLYARRVDQLDETGTPDNSPKWLTLLIVFVVGWLVGQMMSKKSSNE